MNSPCCGLLARHAAGGGFEAVPTNWRAIRNVLSGGFAKGPHARARVDLAFHYTPGLLMAMVREAPLRCAVLCCGSTWGRCTGRGWEFHGAPWGGAVAQRAAV